MFSHIGKAKHKFSCIIIILQQKDISILLFTAVLTPKPFKMAGSAILNDRPCHLHSLLLNKGSKWLSHLKRRALGV